MHRVDRLIEEVNEIMKMETDTVQENANRDGTSPTGMMSLFGSATAKYYAVENLLSDEAREAYEGGYIHIHDLDFYATGTTTCLQMPLGKLLKDGFNTGNGHMREPGSIMSALALTAIALQSSQNQQHGGQAVPMFDYDLAPYVRKTYDKHKAYLKDALRTDDDKASILAWELTDRDTFQAMEAFVHNANSMSSRGGGQVPFVSINFGTDTSAEGRCVTKNILKAMEAGLGNGETAIFPICVFKVKEGVNFGKNDPNYDLYQLSLKVTGKRLFPNYVFVDAPHNIKYYDGTPESEIATMGCRTRVIGNVNGKETPVGRGNLSFTTINLPMLALEANGSIEVFRELLDHYISVAERQLYDRYMYQRSRLVSSFKFLYGQKLWYDSETLDPKGEIGDVLKQGTLSVGFIGLAETLVALIGEHHGESEEAQALGLEIVRYMRERMDEATKRTGLNYSLLATPAESYCYKSLRAVRKRFGVVPGVTDREYFTNSNHVPVYYDIKAVDKIKIEAPYHELTNAGHIAYVELSGEASCNVKALDQIVRAMHKYGIGYGSINHPVDRCHDCGYQAVIHEDECPVCGGEHIDRIRRITGYLVGTLDRFNSGKQSEVADRVKHG